MTTTLVFLRCVCVCVCVCGVVCVCVCVRERERVGVWMGVWGICVCVCVGGGGMLICFVSALSSHEMERHKLPIIIIIKYVIKRTVETHLHDFQ